MISHTGTQKHRAEMTPTYITRMRSSGTVGLAQRLYKRNSQDWCSDLTEQVKTTGWPELEKGLCSFWSPFPQVITCSLLDLHPWICPIRDCCNESIKYCSGTFISHGIYTGRSWDHKCKILGLWDSVAPMWTFFSLYFLWQIYWC